MVMTVAMLTIFSLAVSVNGVHRIDRMAQPTNTSAAVPARESNSRFRPPTRLGLVPSRKAASTSRAVPSGTRTTVARRATSAAMGTASTSVANPMRRSNAAASAAGSE